MGKRRNNRNKKKSKHYKPTVSICTPTFNRRPFIPSAIKCFLHQDYPRDKLEWIIIDDGSDPIEDLVKDVPGVKYFRYEEKMTLGKKRNLMHEKSTGEIIVYMDDDDYYPPCRVSHAVETLKRDRHALCAGSSEIYIWFKHIQQMVQFGPYGPNHATAGTFAFKRELLEQTSYEDHAALAEEKHFLKNYTIPFVQLDPLKTILVFSHEHNTFDKRTLLENRNPKYVKDSEKTVDDFIKEADLKTFFMDEVSEIIKDYDPGLPKHKPEVLRQTAEIKERRKKMEEAMRKQALDNAKIMITDDNGNQRELKNSEIVEMLKQNQVKIKELSDYIKNNETVINVTQSDGSTVTLKNRQILMLVESQSKEIKQLKARISELENNQEVSSENIVINIAEKIETPNDSVVEDASGSSA